MDQVNCVSTPLLWGRAPSAAPDLPTACSRLPGTPGESPVWGGGGWTPDAAPSRSRWAGRQPQRGSLPRSLAIPERARETEREGRMEGQEEAGLRPRSACRISRQFRVVTPTQTHYPKGTLDPAWRSWHHTSLQNTLEPRVSPATPFVHVPPST